MERQNSIESVNGSSEESTSSPSSAASSPSGSVTSEDEDEGTNGVSENDTKEDQDLVRLLKQQTFHDLVQNTSFKSRKRLGGHLSRSSKPTPMKANGLFSNRLKNPPTSMTSKALNSSTLRQAPSRSILPPPKKSSSTSISSKLVAVKKKSLQDASSSSYKGWSHRGLCSIPEDFVQTTSSRLLAEEDQTCHRSPVSIDNGYRPRPEQKASNPQTIRVTFMSSDNDTIDETKETKETSEDESIFEEPFENAKWRGWILWVIFVVRCCMILLCLLTVFVVFVLLTHTPRSERDPRHQR